MGGVTWRHREIGRGMLGKQFVRTTAFAWTVAVAFIGAAYGQSTSNPAHVDERFRPKPPPPTVGAPIDIPATPPTQAPEGGQGAHFRLSAVIFEGNTVFPDARLQAIAAPYIGRDVTIADVYTLADQVTAAYRNAGYILVRAIPPAQQITDGRLTIRIVEGFIDQSKVQGDAGGARPLLEAYGRKIASIRPLTAEVLERELLLASDIAGFRVRSVLTPSPTKQGAADLTLIVDRRPIDAYLSFDNRGSKYLGPLEVQGGVGFNDVFGTAGRLGINAVVTPNSGPELAYGALSYDQPIGTDGLRFFGSVSFTATKPGDILATLDTNGQAINSTVSLSYPFIRSRDLNLTGAVSFETSDVRSSNFAVKPLFSDHIRSLEARVFANFLDSWGGYTAASAWITQGLGIFGATESASPVKSRANASGEFTRANFEVTHDQPLFANLSVGLAGAAQTSFGDNLLASEQFSLGGNAYSRAYDPSEVTGDSALAGRIELRWDAPNGLPVVTNVQPYAFYEGGNVWLEHPLPAEPPSQSLYSAGLGLRFAVASHFSANVEWAVPLNRPVAASGNRNSRVFFVVTAAL